MSADDLERSEPTNGSVSADKDAAWRSRGGRQNMGRNELLAALRAAENRIADIEALADDRERKGLLAVSIDSLRAVLRRTTVIASDSGAEAAVDLDEYPDQYDQQPGIETTVLPFAEGDPS